MKILYYGYGNHCKRIRKAVREYLKNKIEFEEFAIKKKETGGEDGIEIFNSLENVYERCQDVDIVFIATPNDIHLQAFKECLAKKIPYIYVEKPAIGIEEYYRFHITKGGFPLKYLAVGYHFLKNKAFIELKEYINKKEYGEIISMNLTTGHGLAFKEGYAKSWRAKKRLEIANTSASHMISLSRYLQEDETIVSLSQRLSSISNTSSTDTYNGFFEYSNGSCVSIMTTWASPLVEQITVYFTNGIWNYDFNQVEITSPRDIFDDRGYFIKPPKKKTNATFEGITPSINDFLSKALKGKSYDSFFGHAEETSKLISRIE